MTKTSRWEAETSWRLSKYDPKWVKINIDSISYSFLPDVWKKQVSSVWNPNPVSFIPTCRFLAYLFQIRYRAVQRVFLEARWVSCTQDAGVIRQQTTAEDEHTYQLCYTDDHHISYATPVTNISALSYDTMMLSVTKLFTFYSPSLSNVCI